MWPPKVCIPAPKVATRAGIQVRENCPAAKAPVIRPTAIVDESSPLSRRTQKVLTCGVTHAAEKTAFTQTAIVQVLVGPLG